jgi:hypothetical protein
MQRREFVTLFGGAAAVWPLAAWAQSTAKVPLIGVLAALAAAPAVETYRKKFQKLGYVPDKTIAFLGLGAAGKLDTLPVLVEQMVNCMMTEIDAMISWVKSAKPADQDFPVLVAGEPEQIARAARIDNGIEIDDTTWEELSAIAERYQIRLDS